MNPRDPKIERALLLNRQRVQKHREKKRLKLDQAPSPSEEEISSSDGQKDIIQPSPVLIENPQPLDLQNESARSCEESVLPSRNRNNDFEMLHSGVAASSDNECDSGNLIVMHPVNANVVGKMLTGELRIWGSENVTYSKLDSLLRIINHYHPEVPLTSKTLLKTDLQLSHNIRKFNVLDPNDASEYVHFGIACHLLKIVNVKLHKNNILELKFNVDGMTPYKSSPLNFWPILGLVHHEYASYRPFVISAYYGRGKPYSVELFLDDFILELNQLLQEGIVICERKFEVRVKCFCCDRPARAYMKCIVNHGAYYACERCWVSGIQYMNRIVYPIRDCQQRTEESFNNQENPEHHDGISPLLKLRDKNNKTMDLTKLFVQEFMHAGPHGIMKKVMLEQWFSDDSKMTREKKIIGSLRLVNLGDQIPVEFGRTARDLNKLSLWKAKEFRLTLLYIGPFVLKGLLSDDEYKHFLLLYVACRILHSRDLLKKFGNHTKMFLERFVLLCEVIYGLEFVVLNPHILSHLYEDVVNMDCSISQLDAFIFEGYLSELKRCLRSGNRPLAQVCKKIETDLELNPKKVVSTVDLLIMDHKKRENLYHVTKLKFLNFELTTKKPDNVVMMKDGSLVEIKDLICSSLKAEATKLYILGEKLHIIGSAFDYPVSSSALQIFSVQRMNKGDIVKFPLSQLSCKVMLCEIFELSSDERQLFTIPLLPMAAS